MADNPVVVSVRSAFFSGTSDSIEVPCIAGCGYKVWVSPHAVAVMEREQCGAMCTDCALPLFEGHDTPEFATTDGSDVSRIFALASIFGWPTGGV